MSDDTEIRIILSLICLIMMVVLWVSSERDENIETRLDRIEKQLNIYIEPESEVSQ